MLAGSEITAIFFSSKCAPLDISLPIDQQENFPLSSHSEAHQEKPALISLDGVFPY